MVGRDGEVTFEYDIDRNSDLAANLMGHLLLTTGDIDNNVHPAGTYRVAAAAGFPNRRDIMVMDHYGGLQGGGASRSRRDDEGGVPGEGDLALMDGGCGVEGYRSDISRTTVFAPGPPSA